MRAKDIQIGTQAWVRVRNQKVLVEVIAIRTTVHCYYQLKRVDNDKILPVLRRSYALHSSKEFAFDPHDRAGAIRADYADPRGIK